MAKRPGYRRIRYALLALALSHSVSGAFNPNNPTDFVVYWGQNSAGNTGGTPQKSLVDYCADGNFTVINIAFLEQISPPSINFNGIKDYCSSGAVIQPPGTISQSCSDIGHDITTCQTTYNKTILLSIGGAGGIQSGFASIDAAEAAAQNIWNMFGPINPSENNTTVTRSDTSISRPFGSASVNGFDLDIEAVTTNMPDFANELRYLMDRASTPSNKYYLTAAPQCPYPSIDNDAMLNGAVAFDAVFVQFYNNPLCGLSSFQPALPVPSTSTTGKRWFPIDNGDRSNWTYPGSPSNWTYPGPPSNWTSPGNWTHRANCSHHGNWTHGDSGNWTSPCNWTSSGNWTTGNWTFRKTTPHNTRQYTTTTTTITTTTAPLPNWQSTFNFQQWDTWARTISANPNVRVLLGVPGSATAASSGYTSSPAVVDIVLYCKQFKSFGGVMVWDASQVDANEGFVGTVGMGLRVLKGGSRIMRGKGRGLRRV